MTYLIPLLYGFLILVGGVIGYVQAASTVSLASSAASALLLAIASFGIQRGKLWGLYTCLTLTVLLDAFFTYRFLTTAQFFPAGMMMILSSATLLLLILTWQKR